MRETHKDIQLSGNVWRVSKLDPLTGNTLALKLLGKLGHVIAGVAAGGVTNYQVLMMAVLGELGSFTSSELYEIQNICLSACSEVKILTNDVPTALPVRTGDGRWACKGLEDDAVTVLALVAHTIAFNLLPFFDGEVLKPIIASFSTYTLPFLPSM
jgi:hypothetical protein